MPCFVTNCLSSEGYFWILPSIALDGDAAFVLVLHNLAPAALEYSLKFENAMSSSLSSQNCSAYFSYSGIDYIKILVAFVLCS